MLICAGGSKRFICQLLILGCEIATEHYQSFRICSHPLL
jgi:hypothetical protein